MRHILLVTTLCAGAAIGLAGCNQGVSLTNATPEEVAKAADSEDALKLKPGKWEIKVELLGGGPALPAGLPKEVLAKINEATTVTDCISSEEARLGAKRFLETPVVKQMQCNFAKAEIGGGRISSEMNCTIAGIKTTTRSTGTYSATEYVVDGEQTRAGSDRVQKTRTTGKWIGECAPGEK